MFKKFFTNFASSRGAEAPGTQMATIPPGFLAQMAQLSSVPLPTPTNPLQTILQNYRVGIGNQPTDSAVVYAGIDLLASAAARIITTPGALFVVDENRRRVPGNISRSLLTLLIHSPDGNISSYLWCKQRFIEYCMSGNSYILAEKTANNNISRLLSFLPDTTQPSVSDTGKLYFSGKFYRGGPRSERYPADTVAHLAAPNLSPDIEIPGLTVGRSPFSVLRPALAIYNAIERLVYDRYQSDAPMDHTVVEAIEEAIAKSSDANLTQQMINYNQVLIPDTGVFKGISGGSFSVWLPKVKTTRMPSKLNDANFVEHRENSVKEVSRMFHLPPMLLGSEASYVGSSIAEIFHGFWKFGIAPLVHTFTSELSRAALPRNSYLMVDPSDFLRGTPASTAALVAQMLPDAQRPGWVTEAEIRRAAGLTADPDGPVLQGNASASPQSPATVEEPVDQEEDENGQLTDRNENADSTNLILLDSIRKIRAAAGEN